jgi:sulfur carrier protein
MTIEVNTRTMDWVENETVQALLDRMEYNFPLIIVKVDGSLVPKEEYPVHIIKDGSIVEVVHLISGG